MLAARSRRINDVNNYHDYYSTRDAVTTKMVSNLLSNVLWTKGEYFNRNTHLQVLCATITPPRRGPMMLEIAKAPATKPLAKPIRFTGAISGRTTIVIE
jgi:hypothetical protein